MINNEIDTKKDEMPWLIFKIKNQPFAIKSDDVLTIFQVEQEVIPMPEAPKCVRGIINLRGEIVPLLELRNVLGMQSFQEETKDFEEMLEQRKQDHMKWVQEFEKSVKEGTKFTQTMDPHECKFGKWFYSYTPISQTVAFHLNKIEEPHRLLHETGEEILKCKHQKDESEKEKCLNELLRKEVDEYMPTVLQLLEEAKAIFQNSFREMCIVVKDHDSLLGILVDEVVCVEQIAPIGNEENISNIYKTEIISHIANGANVDGEILVINQEKLMQQVK